MSQGSTALRRVFFWSPEQLEARLSEKSLQKDGGCLSFLSLHPNGLLLSCDFWLPKSRFNPRRWWQPSNFEILGKFWWVNKSPAFQSLASEEWLFPAHPSPVERCRDAEVLCCEAPHLSAILLSYWTVSQCNTGTENLIFFSFHSFKPKHTWIVIALSSSAA